MKPKFDLWTTKTLVDTCARNPNPSQDKLVALLEKGADPSAIVFHALKNHNRELINFLLLHGAKIVEEWGNDKALEYLLERDEVELLELFVGSYSVIQEHFDKHKISLIHLACRWGSKKIVKMLLEKGSKPDLELAHEKELWITPIQDAINGGHIDLVHLLLPHIELYDSRELITTLMRSALTVGDNSRSMSAYSN